MILTGILGDQAEKLAQKFLKNQGLKLHQTNYHCRYGEIDIVMQDDDYLVFVEVRYRKSTDFGGALESVDSHKQRKLRNSAEHYLIKNKINDTPCRFDILCVNGNLKQASIDWIQNAF
ncbi:MAG: YraN family protein [Acidiferrobacterales bacterium]|nr:YraN family protein [Acidiferrobacterales bacterium]